jgi:HSP20 family protein
MEPTTNIFSSITDLLKVINQTVQNIERIPKELVSEVQTPAGKHKQIGPIVYGYSMSVNTLDGKPIVREFGNIARPSQTRNNNSAVVLPERKPLVETSQIDDDTFKVTAEMPGISKEHIRITLPEINILEISTDQNSQRKYHQRIELLPDFESSIAKTTYANGILEILLKRKLPGGTKRKITRHPKKETTMSHKS